MDESKFFNFLDPVLSYIDSGKFFRQPFKWLYILIGVLNIMMPVTLIIRTSEIWKYMSGASCFASILIIIVAFALAYIGFIIWFKRGQNLKCEVGESTRFVAIPIVANLLQTIGEWSGVMIGVGGFVITLISLIFGGRELYYIMGEGRGFIALIMFPIIGYVSVVFMRFLAESCLALASIANSAKSIDKKLSETDGIVSQNNTDL